MFFLLSFCAGVSSERNFGGLKDSDFFGSSVSNIGDFDNDGINDIVVGAFQDGVGVVHHGHALALCATRKAVGVVVDSSGFSEEQRVEFAQSTKVVLGDQLHVHAQSLAGLDELL